MNTREIQEWIVAHVAELLHIAPESIVIQDPLSNYGLSSRDALTLSGDLEELLGRRLSPTLAYEYPSILLLSRYLGEQAAIGTGDTKPKSSSHSSTEPIAVIGMGCRFPGAKDPESFWQLLRTGTDAISEVPRERWERDAFYHPDPAVPGKAISYWGGFLENVDQFDPFFFGISPMEAEYMDPQQRLLLELSFEALDDAGQIPENIAGTKTGVFIGISINEYSHFQLSDPSLITSHSGTGSALSIAANRISYFFDFHGPSIAIDTACSSSLAAVHLACQSIRNGECSMALAGGVNMIFSPAHSIAFTKAGVLAADGRCKAFDADADGYVRGEGGGVIVLKTLSSAIADGDPIYALIPGSAMAQDGRTNGLMAPSSEAQESLLREAYLNAGISPGSVQYIETHGTGTLLGDSMEAKALGAVNGTNRTNGACAIGSVKSNIGHLEAAAGIAGLIKVILSIEHRALPPSLHYKTPNPHIPFNDLHLKVQKELDAWPLHSGRAIAGVSSFGFGGTIVHVVVREADDLKQEVHHNDVSNVMMLPLSASSDESLHLLAGRFKELITNDFSAAVENICYNAGLRRSQHDHRLVVLGHSGKELCHALEAFLNGKQDTSIFSGKVDSSRHPKLVLVFPGQGGQWFGMGRELMKQEPVFYRSIETIHRIIYANFGWSLMNELNAERSTSRLDQIDVVQPALFAIQVAVAELWQSWGIKPDAVAGHSMGEVAAAHVAGILSLEDAVRIICSRSQLMRQLRGKGSMLATELSADQAKELIKGFDHDIDIAVINSPASTVLSGSPETINKVREHLDCLNLFCKQVNVDVASHSPQIESLRSDLLLELEGLVPRAATIPFYSTVTGKRESGQDFYAAYWMDNLRKPVLFSEVIGKLLDNGHSTFIEVGPHPVLLGSIQQSILPRHGEVRLVPSMRREEPEQEVLLGTLSMLYTQGFTVDWKKLFRYPGKIIHLPPIQWQRQRYWFDEDRVTLNRWPSAREIKFHPLLGLKISPANSPNSFIWQSEIDSKVLNYLEDHRVDGEVILPASAYIEMAFQAAEETGLLNAYTLSDFVFSGKMSLQSGKPRQLQTLLSPSEGGPYTFSVYSRLDNNDNWILHATANFIEGKATADMEPLQRDKKDWILQHPTANVDADEFYKTLLERGLEYGRCFRGVENVWQKHNEASGRIRLPDQLQFDADKYQIHPALLDACFHVIGATEAASGTEGTYIPTGCKLIKFHSRPGGLMWSHVSLHIEPGADHIQADIRVSGDNGELIAELTGFQFQRQIRRVRRHISNQETWLYQLGWHAQARPGIDTSNLREKKYWLIFAGDEGSGSMLVKQLEARGDSCYILQFCDAVNADEEALRDLIEKQLQAIPSPLYGIIHLWSLSIPGSASGNTVSSDIVQMAGCNSVLLTVQALAKRFAAKPRLWLVTRGAQPVRPVEPIAVEQSMIWGLGKVISFEFPELKCTRIDLDRYQSNTESVSHLLKQILLDDLEDQIAFRGGVRYVLRMLPFAQSLFYTPAVSFKGDGTYLITGGLGGLGLATAKWVAERGARHLVLIGRSEPSATAGRVVKGLRENGVEVLTLQADVSDPLQVAYVFRNLEQNMPKLRGLIHAAGVLDDGSLLNLDTERMNNVMAPKVQGTCNLHQATLNMDLDFFVLFSSVVSVLGSPGQGNYAAASSYLDAMAYYRRSIGLPAISINWGPWADVGLAAEAADRLKEQNASTEHLIKVIKIEEGLEILGQLLSEEKPQVVVLPFDLSNLLELYPTAAGMPFFKEVGGNSTHVTRLYARPKLRQQYVAPRSEIEQKLAELWRQTLHIDLVGVHDSFFELGGDSVLAAQILSLAQKNFGIRINPQDAFKAFTIEKLAKMLEAEIMSRIEEMSEEEAQRLLSENTN